MAVLKDLIVNGASRFIGDIFGTNATFSGDVKPETDNTQSLGDSTHRWKLYGTITGSLDKTFKIKLNNTQYTYDGSANIDLSTIYAPIAGGTANTQALVGNGATATPKWVNISPSISITAGTSSATPKVNVTVLGQSGTAQAITTATTGVYGATKLTDAYTSTDATLAATGKSILAAIQTLDVSSVGGGTGEYISTISETDGKISATKATTTVSNTWTGGTTAGPTIKTTVNGVTGTAVAIPSASDAASGIVTTTSQHLGSNKIFANIDDATAANWYSKAAVQLRESNRVGNAQSTFRYAPRLSFHWLGRIAATMAFHSDGLFYLRKQDGTTRAMLDANLQGYLENSNQYDGTEDYASYAWHKVATVVNTSSQADPWIKLLVSNGAGSQVFGILYARQRNSSSKIWEGGTLYWEYLGYDIDPANFVMRYTNDTSTPKCTAEIWAKMPARWSGYHFIVLNRGGRSTGAQQTPVDDTTKNCYWQLAPSVIGHGSASYTAGTGGIVSTCAGIKLGAVQTYGNVSVGTFTANTAQSAERNLYVKSGAGNIGFWSAAATDGAKGIWSVNAAGTGATVLGVNQSNYIDTVARFANNTTITAPRIRLKTVSRYLDWDIYKNDAKVAEIWYDTGHDTNNTTGQFFWCQWSPTADANATLTSYKETYSLPAVTTGRTGDGNYNILTTKSTITVAQGGTGNTSYTANRLIYSESASKLSAHSNLILSTEITYAGRTITPLLRANGILYTDDRVEAKNYFLVNKDSNGASYYLHSNNAQYGRFWVDTIGTANSGDGNATRGIRGETWLYVGNNTTWPATGTAGGANNARGSVMIYGEGSGYVRLRQGEWYGSNLSVISGGSTTANTAHYSYIIAGNNANVSTTTSHTEGRLRLYSAATHYHELAGSSTTTNYTHTLPNANGTIAQLGDMMWNTIGTVLPDSANLNTYNETGSKLGLWYSGSSTKTATLGTPPFTNSGFRMISLKGYGTVRGHQIVWGTSPTPYLRTENGTANTYSAWSKLVYIQNDSNNANVAVGSSTQPVYVNSDGKVVAITGNIANGTTGNAATATTATKANYLQLYEARGTTTTLNKAANYVAAGAMFHLVASSSTSATDNGKPPMGDANVLQMNWDNNGGYDAQLAISTAANRMEFRDQVSTKKAWREVVTSTPGTQVGSSSQPVYISSTGVATAITGAIANNTTGNAATATHAGSKGTANLSTASWTDDTSVSGCYTKTVTISGLATSDNVHITPVLTIGTKATREKEQAVWGLYVYAEISAANTLKFYFKSAPPTELSQVSFAWERVS